MVYGDNPQACLAELNHRAFDGPFKAWEPAITASSSGSPNFNSVTLGVAGLSVAQGIHPGVANSNAAAALLGEGSGPNNRL